MLGGMKEDDKWKVDFLTNDNVGWGGRDIIDTSVINVDVLRNVHVLMNTTLVACNRMIIDNPFDDIVVVGGNLIAGRTSDGRKGQRDVVQARQGASLFQVPWKFGIEACLSEVAVPRKKDTYCD